MFLQVTPQIVSAWSRSEIAALIAALATAVYTIGTFLLWLSTRRSIYLTKESIDLAKESVNLTKKQMARNEDVLQQSAIQTVYKNFRELYTLILKDNKDVTTLALAQGVTVDTLRENYLGSFLINHAFEIFCMYERGIIPKDFWERVVRDMKVLFSWQFVNERWSDVRILYTREFQILIDDEIIDHRPGSRQ